MDGRDRFWDILMEILSTLMGATILLVVVAVVLVSGWFIADLAFGEVPHSPKFSSKECFHSIRGDDEGIVMYSVSGSVYVIMMATEAMSHHEPKQGHLRDVRIFDDTHYKVECPTAWSSQAGKKR